MAPYNVYVLPRRACGLLCQWPGVRRLHIEFRLLIRQPRDQKSVLDSSGGPNVVSRVLKEGSRRDLAGESGRRPRKAEAGNTAALPLSRLPAL